MPPPPRWRAGAVPDAAARRWPLPLCPWPAKSLGLGPQGPSQSSGRCSRGRCPPPPVPRHPGPPDRRAGRCRWRSTWRTTASWARPPATATARASPGGPLLGTPQPGRAEGQSGERCAHPCRRKSGLARGSSWTDHVRKPRMVRFRASTMRQAHFMNTFLWRHT